MDYFNMSLESLQSEIKMLQIKDSFQTENHIQSKTQNDILLLNTDYFSDLPDELLLIIISFIESTNTYLALRAVCKNFYRLLYKPLVFENKKIIQIIHFKPEFIEITNPNGLILEQYYHFNYFNTYRIIYEFNRIYKIITYTRNYIYIHKYREGSIINQYKLDLNTLAITNTSYPPLF